MSDIIKKHNKYFAQDSKKIRKITANKNMGKLKNYKPRLTVLT